MINFSELVKDEGILALKCQIDKARSSLQIAQRAFDDAKRSFKKAVRFDDLAEALYDTRGFDVNNFCENAHGESLAQKEEERDDYILALVEDGELAEYGIADDAPRWQKIQAWAHSVGYAVTGEDEVPTSSNESPDAARG
jgi:hypothetical protein